MSGGLTTYDLYTLDQACRVLEPVMGHRTYLVGSADERADYRDVDVRTILPDDEFDAMFSNVRLWELFCLGVTAHLRFVTGLPIDYQVQRQTNAAKFSKGSRNPLGIGPDARIFAGGGDGTPYFERPANE